MRIEKYFKDLSRLLKENIRDYGMFIALGVIMLIFALSNSLFLSPRNISNLINQTGYIAVLSVGMTLVIIIRHIDLSVGYVSGFIGAVAATLMMSYGVPVFFVIIIVLIIGTIIGLWHGFLVAYMKLPAFVATLAGMLIFRGAIMLVTQGTGTIIIRNDFFNSISNGYLPDIGDNSLHLVTMAIAVIMVGLYVVSELHNYKIKKKYEFEVLSPEMLISKIIFLSFIILGLSYILASHRGLPYTIIIVAVVVMVYHFLMNFTILGRYIYAVGGNPEAAELSGISVKLVTLFVFSSMGFLSAVSGIMFASRLQSATVTAGQLFELQAIAGAFVGGVSASGGVGKVIGSVIGALVMASLSNGMNLLGINISIQYMVQGAVLIAAVIFDIKTRNKA